MRMIAAWSRFTRSVWPWVRTWQELVERAWFGLIVQSPGVIESGADVASEPVAPVVAQDSSAPVLGENEAPGADATRSDTHGGWLEMSETKRDDYIGVEVREGGQRVATGAQVIAEIVDLDPDERP